MDTNDLLKLAGMNPVKVLLIRNDPADTLNNYDAWLHDSQKFAVEQANQVMEGCITLVSTIVTN